MKKYVTPILIAALIITTTFGIVKQIQINNLNRTIKDTEGTLINSFYNKTSLIYTIDKLQLQNNFSKDNAEALARELSFIQKYFYSIFTLNEAKINFDTNLELDKNIPSNKCVNYLYKLASQPSLNPKDIENLDKLKDAYNEFCRNVTYDTGLTAGVSNINSLGRSYVDFIRKVERVLEH